MWQGMRPVEGVGVALRITVKEGKPPEGLKQVTDMTSSFKKRKSVGGCVEAAHGQRQILHISHEHDYNKYLAAAVQN